MANNFGNIEVTILSEDEDSAVVGFQFDELAFEQLEHHRDVNGFETHKESLFDLLNRGMDALEDEFYEKCSD